MDIKIRKDGKITIPKRIREEYNLKPGVTLAIDYYQAQVGPRLMLRPKHFCFMCGKALPDELTERGACLTCVPAPWKTLQIY